MPRSVKTREVQIKEVHEFCEYLKAALIQRIDIESSYSINQQNTGLFEYNLGFGTKYCATGEETITIVLGPLRTHQEAIDYEASSL